VLEIEVEFAEVNVAVLDTEVVAEDIVFVRVNADEPVAEEALYEPLTDELEAEPPVIWNGKEYWNVVGAESRVILKP